MFYIGRLEWSVYSEAHIARHGVEPHEVEELVRNAPYVTRAREHKYRVVGQSDSGRFLTVILAAKRRWSLQRRHGP